MNPIWSNNCVEMFHFFGFNVFNMNVVTNPSPLIYGFPKQNNVHWLCINDV